MSDHTQVLTIKLTPDMMNMVARFAVENGYVDMAGSANMSAAGRTLIAVGLAQDDGQAIARAAFVNARSDILQRVAKRLAAVLTATSNEIGSGDL